MDTFQGRLLVGLMFLMVLLTACNRQQSADSEANDVSLAAAGTLDESMTIKAPVAERRAHILEAHGLQRNDPYYWLRDDQREAADVLAYLEVENQYTDQLTASHAELGEQLYQELIARIPGDDASVPYQDRGFWYARQYQQGKELPIHVRWSQSDTEPQGEPEVLLDENQLKGELEFYQIGDYDVSADGRWLAWTEDTISRGIHRLKFRDLHAQVEHAEVIEMVSSEVLFANDNHTVFYVKLQQDTLIPWQIWRHQLGTEVSHDQLVYQEDDPAYFTSIGRSRDNRYIIAQHISTLTTEIRLLDANQPEQVPQVILPRQQGHEYSVETLGDRVFLLTNDNASNFRVVYASLATIADRGTWQEVVPENTSALISDFAVFREHLVLSVIDNANQLLKVIPLDQAQAGAEQSWEIAADEPAFEMSIDTNPSSDTSRLRYTYESPATPLSWYEVDLNTGERRLLKRSFAGNDYDPAQYKVARLVSTARDGMEVPVTLLYQQGLQPDGSHPMYLLGYGSYGSSYLPGFQRDMLSLVDRGFVFALAHIRGGQEKGRAWYEHGKLLNKKNTFTDFIDVGRDMQARGWAARDKLVGSGRSAGGLLISAVANMAPEIFEILIAGVPFVDVITTMLDESIPLTTFEFDEWGNPKDKEYYDYMLSYSPYDQISAQEYPHLYVTTGLWDPAVQYWEPAKWVAKLRHNKTDNNTLVMRTDMNAGHRGGSGRYERQHDRAREYAFILSLLESEKQLHK